MTRNSLYANISNIKERDVENGSRLNITESLGNLPKNLKYKLIKNLYLSDD